MTKTIFIAAYRNFSIRYILYSDILKTLKANGYRIVVFVRDPNTSYYSEKLRDKNVIVESVIYEKTYATIKNNFFAIYFSLIRKMVSGGNNTSKNLTDKIRVKQYQKEMSYDPKARIIFVFIRIIAWFLNQSSILRRIFLAIEGKIFPGKDYDEYFEKYKPEALLISSTGFMLDPFMMRAARRHNCRVISIIHSWDNPSTKDYRGAKPDKVIVWNKIMKDEVAVFHDIEEKNIFIGGIAHWDFYFHKNYKKQTRAEFLKKYGFDGDRKIIFYGSSNPILFPNTLDVVEQLLIAIREEQLAYPCQLLVRLHPAYKLRAANGYNIDKHLNRIESLQKKYGDIVHLGFPEHITITQDVDMPVEDMYGLADILQYSDLMLTEYSTLMIEGAIFDVPVINVGLYNNEKNRPRSNFESYTHIQRIIRTKACQNVYSFETLFNAINNYLKDPSLDRGYRKNLVDQEVTANPGCAGTEIAGYISSVIEN